MARRQRGEEDAVSREGAPSASVDLLGMSWLESKRGQHGSAVLRKGLAGIFDHDVDLYIGSLCANSVCKVGEHKEVS